MSRSPEKSQTGFVLVATLWVIVLMTMAIGYFSERTSRALGLAQKNSENIQVLIEQQNARAELLYRLATTSISVYGLGPTEASSIALDNRPYRIGNLVMARLQDNRGLVNLNYLSNERLYRLLGILGVAAEKRDALIDALLDYTDEDNLRRLNGAEAPEYRARGLPPPANDYLRTPFEARTILGWGTQRELWENLRLNELITTSPVAGLNPNTAPWQVLATLPNVTDDVARQMITQRQLRPLTHGDIQQITGMSAGDMMFMISTIPGPSIRVIQTSPSRQWAMQYNVTLTPFDNGQPWHLDYTVLTRTHYKDDNIEKTQPLPQQPANAIAGPPAFLLPS